MITSHKGKVAPMMEARPPEMYFTPQVDRALLNMKFSKVNIRTVSHSFPLGIDLPLLIKKITYIIPPMNCLIAAICKAGICFTPSREAIQVVPQKKDTNPTAIRALVCVSSLLSPGNPEEENFLSVKAGDNFFI
jgi:hypothetical protein